MANRTLPNHIHKLKGSLRKHRHGTSMNAVLDAEYPKPPDYIFTINGAEQVWQEVAAIMQATGLYSRADANKLARYCVLEANFRDDPVSFCDTAARLTQLRLLENDLYLSPEARAKVAALVSLCHDGGLSR